MLHVTTYTDLSPALHEELKSAIRGEVYLRDNANFVDYSTIFNGNVKTAAKAVVCPVSAEDVSEVVLFCTKHGLSPSVKAGGYGTAGWSIGGDIIIDLHKLADLDIEPPNADGSFTSLRDMVPIGSKGKGKAAAPLVGPSGGKRRREADAELRDYDSASRAVATFLKGPPLPHDSGDQPRPSIRRRFDTQPSGSNERVDNQRSVDLSTPERTLVDRRVGTADVTAVRSADPPAPISSASYRSNDPFGYLNDPATEPPPNTMQSAFHPRSLDPASDPAAVPIEHPNLSREPIGFPTPPEPVHTHAYVTFGPGKRQKEIDMFTAANPLQARDVYGGLSEIPYHVPFAAHPAGSTIMLLGGFGFTSRLRGLSIDNLVEVEMVLADGRIIIVNEKEHPDLWWAARGAGPVLGIATRYKAKAFPIPVVFAGNLIYRFHTATAPSLIKHYRDCIKGAPRELYANLLLTAGPAGQDSLVVIQMCYVGPKERGLEFLEALAAWDGEACLLNEVAEKNFLNQQDSVAQVLRGKAGRQWFIRSALIASLPDDIVHKTVLQFAGAPVGCTWLFELAGGAIGDYEDTCLPKTQREAAFTIAALHQWDMGVDDPRCIVAAEEWIAGTLAPVAVGGAYPSFLGRHEPAARTMACYGGAWERLREVKAKYDPTGVFRNTFWPLDTEGKEVEPHTHEPVTP